MLQIQIYKSTIQDLDCLAVKVLGQSFPPKFFLILSFEIIVPQLMPINLYLLLHYFLLFLTECGLMYKMVEQPFVHSSFPSSVFISTNIQSLRKKIRRLKVGNAYISIAILILQHSFYRDAKIMLKCCLCYLPNF